MRKKEIIAASLVVLIGMAGYLNWSYRDTIHIRDNESYIETGKKLGEAQYVNSVSEDVEETAADAKIEDVLNNSQSADGQSQDEQTSKETFESTEGDATYFEQARLNREQARSKSIEILNTTAENANIDEEARKKAGDEIIAAAKNVEKEQAIESIAQSKGYSEICAVINGENVNIMVRKEGFGEQDAARLTEIAVEQTKISANNVKVVEVK